MTNLTLYPNSTDTILSAARETTYSDLVTSNSGLARYDFLRENKEADGVYDDIPYSISKPLLCLSALVLM